MPITNVYAVKGGQGTTVMAAALALAAPHPVRLVAPTVDELNDLCAALGLPMIDIPITWQRIPVNDTVTIELNPWWYDDDTADTVIVSGDGHVGLPGVRNLLVTRPCYLALRRSVACNVTPDGIIMIGEPGRALGRRDIENALRAPVIVEMAYDPTVARAVDAGLLSSRFPKYLRDAVRPLYPAQEVR